MTSKKALLVLWSNFLLFIFAKIRQASEFLTPITIKLFNRGVLIRHDAIWVWVNSDSPKIVHKLTVTKVKKINGMWYFYERPEQIRSDVKLDLRDAPLCDYDFNTAFKYYKML